MTSAIPAALGFPGAATTPAGPNRKKYLIAGFVLALGLGFGLAFALELIDRRLRDPQAIAALLGTTSLGMVPRVEGRKAPPERRFRLGGVVAEATGRDTLTWSIDIGLALLAIAFQWRLARPQSSRPTKAMRLQAA